MCKCKVTAYKKRKQEEENRQKQYDLRRIISNSLMDTEFKQMIFENWNDKFANPKMLFLAKKYAEKFKMAKDKNIGLIIYGTPGGGKTYACGCIANHLLSQGVPVICVGITQLLQRIQQTFNSYGKEGAAEILKGINKAELLIIDDLGTEQESEWSKSMVYQIIDSRCRNGKPLIVTTNIPLKEIEIRYDKRTYDRLINKMCTPYENKWGSIREKLGENKTNALKELLK